MLRYFFISFILATVAVIVIFGFQGTHFSQPPIQIFPDMKVQPKYIAQHESDFYADGRDGRAPVAGTVPQGYIMPGAYSTNTASNSDVATGENGFSNSLDYLNTGKIGDSYGDGFPMPVTQALLARGQKRFNINCAVCHGAAGYGNGITTQLGLVGVANFQQDRLRNMPDGEIFNTITNGKNTMGPYGSNIAVEDRWAIISYIRALQRSQNAKIDDVPAGERKNLDQQTSVKP
jgi:mono/diheme cytochrome c family protein